jgi:hypothetical protein
VLDKDSAGKRGNNRRLGAGSLISRASQKQGSRIKIIASFEWRLNVRTYGTYLDSKRSDICKYMDPCTRPKKRNRSIKVLIFSEMLNPLGIFLSSLSRLLPRQLTRRSPLDVCSFSKRYAHGMKHEIPHEMQSSWGGKNERVLMTHPCVRHWVRVVDVATDA